MKRAGSKLQQDPKRPKHISQNPEETNEHKPGSIVRVTLTNFLTYSDVTVFPGPHLNVLIGPNGSGKSTIVCALALGLGGSPKLLGRSKETSSFIKHGCDFAEIEIELKGKTEGKNVVLYRELKRSRAADIYKINGKPATKESVNNAVKGFDVQIENLCQFLPQDKVVAFAQLNPCDLLKETEKAVGGTGMLKQHLDLISSKKAVIQSEVTLNAQSKELEELRQANADLEEEVAQFKKRASIIAEADMLKKKRPWVEFEDSRRLGLIAQKEATEAEAAYNEAAEELAPLQKEISQQKAGITTLETKIAKNVGQLKSLDQQRKTRTTKMDSYQDAVDGVQNDIKNLHKRAQERKKKIDTVKGQIEFLKEELKTCPTPEDIKERVAATDAKMREVEEKQKEESNNTVQIADKVRAFEQDMREKLQLLNSLQDVKKQKLNIMRNAAPATYATYDWVQNNRGLFEKEIVFPFLDIQVKDDLHAKYLEHQLAKNVWIVICQTDKDRDTLAKQTDAREWRVLIIKMQSVEGVPSHPVDINTVKQFGVTHWLDQTFEAPPLVKQALRDMSNLDRCLAGTQKTEQALTQCLRVGVTIYTPIAQHIQTQSRYGTREKTTKTTTLNKTQQKSIFSGGIDDRRQKDLERDLTTLKEEITPWKAKQKQTGEIERDLAHKMEELRKEKGAIQREGNKKVVIEKKILPLKDQLNDLAREEDIEAEEQKLKEKIKGILHQRFLSTRDMMDTMKAMTRAALDNDSLVIKKMQLKSILQRDEQKLATKQNAIKQLDVDRKTKKQRQEDLKVRCRTLLDKAKEGGPLDAHTKEIFLTLPQTLEEIDVAISACLRKADALFIANPRVIEDYESRTRKIDALQGRVDTLLDDMDTAKTRIAEIEAPWLEKLMLLQAKIHAKFSEYMVNIGCRGEVKIRKDEDYDKWGVEIWVAYRKDEPLAILDSHHQSGGERSVATMLYLISLHDLTPCPFRVVDEINQGMDPVNERMIFQEVVDAACRPGLAQYFLITPKLLTDLKYSAGVTVLCVFNGPWLKEHFDAECVKGIAHGSKQPTASGDESEEEESD